jgi:3-hydroxymyristoyl/3-hydroxydecanoyl-(acyl carrier protein) dehydratase
VRAAAAAPAEATITFCIAPDHPALPGHFPGAPVVPGALLLTEGLERLGALAGKPIRTDRIDSAKFLRPVAAGARITAALTRSEQGQARIEFSVAGTPVAQVTFNAMPTAGAQAHE